MIQRTLINILLAASFLTPSLLPTDTNLCTDKPAPTDVGVTDPSTKNVCNYTMNVGVRLLLFWVGWKNVGGGRIAWGEEPDGKTLLELLIGSDPLRAPRHINRWGYIKEHVSGSNADLIGIMTQSDEATISQAKSSIDRSEKKHAFKAIRSRLTGMNAQSSTIQLYLDEDFTYRDAASLLHLIPASGSSVKRLRIPDGTDPGFLYAVKAMIQESVERYRQSGELNGLKTRRYVYNASLYTLSVVSSKLLQAAMISGREHRNLVESRFEAHNMATDETTKFSITYGTDAKMSKVPVRIIYQPRWWFRAELLLDGNARML